MDKGKLKQALLELFREGEIKIVVNIEPEHAERGDGQWNVTKTWVGIGGSPMVEIGDGRVEIIEGR